MKRPLARGYIPPGTNGRECLNRAESATIQRHRRRSLASARSQRGCTAAPFCSGIAPQIWLIAPRRSGVRVPLAPLAGSSVLVGGSHRPAGYGTLEFRARHGGQKMLCVPTRQTMCGSPWISSPYSKVARPSAGQLIPRRPGSLVCSGETQACVRHDHQTRSLACLPGCREAVGESVPSAGFKRLPAWLEISFRVTADSCC